MMERMWLLLCFLSELLLPSCCLRQYYFVAQPLTWAEARSFCRLRYTDLASVEDAEQQSLFIQTLQSSGSSSRVWIGLQQEAEWRWSDGSGGTWNDYPQSRGSFSSVSSIPEYCMKTSVNSTWTHSVCQGSLRFICYEGPPENREFFLVDDPLSWSGAQSYCRRHHVDLATVRDATDNQLIQSLLPDGDPAWIGLYRAGNLSWSDGSPFSFFVVLHSFIVWPAATGGRCGSGYINDRYHWTLLPCEAKYPFICQGFAEPVKQVRVKLRLQADGSVDLNDPAVRESLLVKLKESVRVAEGSALRLEWREQSDGQIFNKQN